MYRSKLASLIEDAMNECITFGQGITRHESTSVQADWTEEESLTPCRNLFSGGRPE